MCVTPDDGVVATDGEVGQSPLVITAPHASNALPEWLSAFEHGQTWSDLRDQHWAYDRGVSQLAHQLSAVLGARLVEGNVSRLAIDLNRDLADFSIVPDSISGTGRLEFNASAPNPELAARWLLHARFHDKIDEELSAALSFSTPVFLIDLHSFDRFGPTKRRREVDLGICVPGASDFAVALFDLLVAKTRGRGPAESFDVQANRMNVRLDEPYSADHPGAYITRRHTGPNVFGVVIEVCDELLANAGDVQAVNFLLCSAVRSAIKRLSTPIPTARERMGS